MPSIPSQIVPAALLSLARVCTPPQAAPLIVEVAPRPAPVSAPQPRTMPPVEYEPMIVIVPTRTLVAMFEQSSTGCGRFIPVFRDGHLVGAKVFPRGLDGALLKGDVIVSMNQRSIDDPLLLRSLFAKHPPQELILEIERPRARP